MKIDRLQELLSKFGERRILVVGDLMLDEFIWGRVKRISPEAPVPVVEVQRESFYPGGCANVARNLCEFASGVAVMGVIGDDDGGRLLADLLEERGIGMDGVLRTGDRPTIRKTRIIARQQQVVRVDREIKGPLTPAQRDTFLERFRVEAANADAVILEDYGKGLFTGELTATLLAAARECGCLTAADINPNNPIEWRGVDIVKPNRGEALAAAGLPATDPVEPATDDGAVREAGRILVEKWGAKHVLVTLGEQGMMLFGRDGAPPYHTPTRAREVFDVSGAGDTAIALFTLALASGSTPEEAAEISNHASGVAVAKLGTATVSPQELTQSFRQAP